MSNTDIRIASMNLHHKSTIIARAKIETANVITRNHKISRREIIHLLELICGRSDFKLHENEKILNTVSLLILLS